MSQMEITHKLPLHKRVLAASLSAVLAISLCPITEALADTGSKASDDVAQVSEGAAQDSTQTDDQDTESATSQTSDSAVSAQSVSNGKDTDTKNTWNEDGTIGTMGDGSLEFVLEAGGSQAGSLWSKGSFGNVDYDKANAQNGLALKVYQGGGHAAEVTEDFKVSSFDKTVGDHSVTVECKTGAYTGKVELSYKINSKSIAKCTVSSDFKNGGYYAYTGGAIKAKLKIYDGIKKLTEGKDYTLVYENNVSGQDAYVRAKGINNYDGETSKHKFHIVGLTYNSYGQGKWKGWTNQGGTSGKGSGTKKVGRMQVDRMNSALSGTVSYTMYNDKKKTSGSNTKKGKYSAAGIAGQAAQYMTVSLSGDLAKRFDVYYRTYISGAGWMAWAKNGAKAGVKNFNSRMKMCGYQIKLVEKSGGTKPANADLYTSFESNWDSFAKDVLYSRIKNMSSTTSYCITVDTTFNRVAIYTGSKGKWKLKKYWKCGTGIKSRPTTKGDFKLKSYKRARIDSGKISYWNFHGYGGSLGFHSALTKRGSRTKYSKPLSQQLGTNISHGCVRLHPNNAKYVYNMPNGTAIRIKGLV